ncbi:uncharacterized protein LOC108137776 isoform X9 [Drosophila elegans]|uniref:uncharacterized protein LOC108137776 isoform X9 n=1 Tax=Drosophila elegans TaxID=30023 RepID=UPI001BC84DAD|nr:uncharacterized protein LOC108137776 isoform X9 [Drosophila elegans]
MTIFLNLRLFISILILREACTTNSEEKVTMANQYLLSDEYIVQFSRGLSRGPYFDTSATKNVTSLVGKTGHLNCRIKNLGNKTVSWIRHRDLHLLTVSESTYTSDQRFTSIYNKQTGDWSLQTFKNIKFGAISFYYSNGSCRVKTSNQYSLLP